MLRDLCSVVISHLGCFLCPVLSVYREVLFRISTHTLRLTHNLDAGGCENGHPSSCALLSNHHLTTHSLFHPQQFSSSQVRGRDVRGMLGRKEGRRPSQSIPRLLRGTHTHTHILTHVLAHNTSSLHLV